MVYLEENGHLNIALEEMRSKMKKIEAEVPPYCPITVW